MDTELKGKLSNALNSYYGDEFDQNSDTPVKVIFQFEDFTGITNTINALGLATQRLGVYLAEGSPDRAESEVIGYTIDELSKLQKRFTSPAIFDALNVLLKEMHKTKS